MMEMRVRRLIHRRQAITPGKKEYYAQHDENKGTPGHGERTE